MDASRESSRIGRDDEAQSTKRARPPWIVVADDDKDTRCRVAGALRADDYIVIEASDGIELLDYISAPLPHRQIADKPSALIMALWMPGVSGLAILGGLRNASWATPILLLTERLHRELRWTFRRLGANAIFEKPFDIDDLRTELLNLVPGATRSGDRHHVLRHAAPAQAIPDDMLAETG